MAITAWQRVVRQPPLRAARHRVAEPRARTDRRGRRSSVGKRHAHAGLCVCQRKRKLVEQVFGWMKTVGGLRKLRRRGGELVHWTVTFTAATYNMVRMRRLLAGA